MNANQDSNHPVLNLADTAASNGTFNTFLQATDKAGLKDVLSGVGPHTILAPTDAAFDKLPVGRLEELYHPDNKAELAGIINYHVIKGRRTSAELGKWSTARTAHGQEAPINRDGGKVTIDGANFTAQDMESTNGILHGIDKVNIPVTKRN